MDDGNEKPDTAVTVEATSRQSPLISCIKSAFGDTTYSDLTIKCGDRTWNAHSVIVCGQAPFFKGALSGDFKEAESKKIDLEDDDPDVINEMLRYLYTEDYFDEPETTDDTHHNGLVMSVMVHTAADKYQIPPLCELATKKFATRATREWNTGAFAIAIEEMYRTAESSKKELHKHAVQIAVEHADVLLYQDFGARFRKAAEAVPKFAAEFSFQIFEARKDRLGESRYKCPHCCKIVCMETASSETNVNRACPYCCQKSATNSWLQHAV